MPNSADFKVEKGRTFSKTLTWRDENKTPIDLTGYTVTMPVREKKERGSPHLFDVTVTMSNAVGGEFIISIDSTTTATLNWRQGYFDIDASLPGSPPFITNLVHGLITVYNTGSG